MPVWRPRRRLRRPRPYDPQQLVQLLVHKTGRWRVLGNQVLNVRDDFLLAAGCQQSFQPLDPARQHVPAQRMVVDHAHLFLVRSEYGFADTVEFLDQLLSGTQTGEMNVDVLIWHLAGEANHVLREIDDPDRLAHIENKNLRALAAGRCLENERHGFGDGHEIAACLWVGDFDGSARGNLRLEDRNHAAVAAEHVAETHGHASRADAVRAAGGDDSFAHALGRAHHTDRIDRLVRGDHQQAPHVVLKRYIHQVPGTQDVIAHCFAEMRFHHGHMFVRGRMEDTVYVVPVKHFRQTKTVADIAQGRHQFQLRIFFAKLVFDAEELALRLVECHQTGRLIARNLTAQLRADGARGARDENGSSGDARADWRVVQPDGLAAQQIVYRQVAHLCGQKLSAEQLV